MPSLAHTTNAIRRAAGPPHLAGLWAIAPNRVHGLPARAAANPPAAMPPPPVAAPPYDVVDGVAVVTLNGVMMKSASPWDALLGPVCDTAAAAHAVRAAAADPRVAALLLYVESPGGMVAGTADLADAVADAGRVKPTAAHVEDCGSSAAYWVACQCGTVTANSTAVVGSVGVYSVLADTGGAQDAAGVRLTVVSTGPYKGLGADGQVGAALRDDVQRQVDALGALFMAAIARGRGMTDAEVAAVSDGRAWIGADAIAVRLVDRVCGVGDALAAVAAEAAAVLRPALPAGQPSIGRVAAATLAPA